MNPLYGWLQSHGFWVRSSPSSLKKSHSTVDSRQLTHVFLDGGRASVPAASLPDFWSAYASVVGQRDQHVVERVPTDPTHELKMFLDIDIKFGSVDTGHCRDTTISSIINTIFSCLPQDLRQGAVILLEGSRGPSRGPSRDSSGDTKCGFHLVWTRVVVDGATASTLRDEIVANCEARAEKKVPWGDIIDRSVYRSGLRMPYSCKGMARDMCSVYVPTKRVEFHDDNEDSNKSIQMYYDEGDNAPMTPKPDDALLAETSLHLDPRKASSYYIRVTRKKSSSRAVVVMPTRIKSTTSITLEAKVRAHLPPMYADCAFTRMYVHTMHATVHLDSKYCHNLQREHHSNRVYLYIDARGIWQRCFCRCTTMQGRLSGRLCKDYSFLLAPHDVLGFGVKLGHATSSLTVHGDATDVDFWCKRLLAKF